MGKVFSKKRLGTANVVDLISANKSQQEQELDAKIENLIDGLSPMAKQKASLNTIDAVIGRPEEKLIPRELLDAAPNEWNLFPAASDEKVKEISESIKQYGLFHNITVWARDNGRYMILGGHTRVACFDYLAATDTQAPSQWTNIPALVYGSNQITETDAQRIVIVSNTDQKDISTATRSKAYMRLYQLEKQNSFYGSGIHSRQAAAIQANISSSMFYMYLRLLDLIPELQNDVDSNELSVKAGFHISFLPKDIQEGIYREGLHRGISTQAAAQIKDCETLEDIKHKLTDISNTPKYYKYTIHTRHQKPKNMDVLPLFIEKDSQKAMLEFYITAIRQSDFPQDVKEKLLQPLIVAQS